ncbi:pseudouridine-5'-phosphate glycosidase [Micromonospora sp. NPDC047738]|uniref:pseudouridine-5'-phosphate glycosidase n=1 Tax=unclassified Micromonospora TaxID=2617518 RepID=UPI0033DF1BF1
MTTPASDRWGGLPVEVHPEVAEALRHGGPVVALESTIISHGLPRDSNMQVARDIEQSVRAAGAVPATIAVLDGRVRVGLDEDALHQIASRDDVNKASIRDVAVTLARRVPGATTVASTAWLASLVGIEVFATGGLGGVHRGAATSWDESADLMGLATAPIVVVCAGVKSILDVPATLERLESLSVGVVGYRTDIFPGFYVRQTEMAVPWRVETPEEVARIHAANRALGNSRALVVANPIEPESEMDPDLHDEVLAAGLAALREQDVRGKDVTPFLLAFFHERTGGASLQANVDLVLANARLAGRIAVAGTGG